MPVHYWEALGGAAPPLQLSPHLAEWAWLPSAGSYWSLSPANERRGGGGFERAGRRAPAWGGDMSSAGRREP